MVTAAKQKHAHYWYIDTWPIDNLYHARCRLCGHEREFWFIPEEYIEEMRLRTGRMRGAINGKRKTNLPVHRIPVTV